MNFGLTLVQILRTLVTCPHTLRIILKSRTAELPNQLEHCLLTYSAYLNLVILSQASFQTFENFLIAILKKSLKYFAIYRSFSTLPGSLRLVDSTLWCMGSISACHAWEWNCSVRVNILQEQDGCPTISRLQPCSSRLFYGHLSRFDYLKKIL